MFSTFKEIGKRYGPFDFTLMHIGAYADEWPKVHMTPEEAVQAHIDIGGKIFVPIHWGTFRLAFHDWNDPAERLHREAQRKHLRYVIPVAGESISNPQLPPVRTWWREDS
jgi:L-ascorbate metabolism protein UlaG (beta-lactamase superfamily)